MFDCPLADTGSDTASPIVGAVVVIVLGVVLLVTLFVRRRITGRHTTTLVLVGLLLVGAGAVVPAQTARAATADPCPTSSPTPTTAPTASPTPTPTPPPPATIVDGAAGASVDLNPTVPGTWLAVGSIVAGPTATGPIPVGSEFTITIVGTGTFPPPSRPFTITSVDPRLSCAPTTPGALPGTTVYTCTTTAAIAPAAALAALTLQVETPTAGEITVTTTITNVPGDANPANNTATASRSVTLP